MPARRRLCAAVLCLLGAVRDSRAVTPVPVGALLRYKANYFNLAHKRIRFTPRGPGAYEVSGEPAIGPIGRGSPLGKPSDPRSYSWHMPLPFRFEFGGKSWNEVYINLDGSLTFGSPETAAYPEGDSWPDGTMRSMAADFDIRAFAGQQRLIVPLWGLNSGDSTHIFTRSTRGAVTVMWRAVRDQKPNQAYMPLGESDFQVTLERDGSIEFRYGDVAEKDGIVGIFPGPGVGKVLDRVDLPPAANLAPEYDLRSAAVEDRGAGLRFLLTFAGPIPSQTSQGHLYYGAAAVSGGEANVMRIAVDSGAAKSDSFCQVVNPHGDMAPSSCPANALAVRAANTVELYLPKAALRDPSRLEWKAGMGKNEDPDLATTGELRPVPLKGAAPFGFDFAGGRCTVSGNAYEIFSYPFLAKSRSLTFQEIYKRAPAEDDLAVALTDFRIDDLYDHGASNSAGGPYGDPREIFNSPALQQAAGPVYAGPRFGEVIEDGGRTFRNYAYAVSWAAHEMTHRWVATLRWNGSDPRALLSSPDYVHWSSFLYTPAVTPVWALFTDSPYPEESIMGGMNVEKLPNGATQSRIAPFGAPTGLCALDLYSMGLIGPEEVPDTFLITGAVPDGNGGYKGGDAVPVRIADIIAANGPQTPPAKDVQRRFRFEIYLLYEDGREPDPAKLAQARGIQAAVIEYFKLATNGRMVVAPGR